MNPPLLPYFEICSHNGTKKDRIARTWASEKFLTMDSVSDPSDYEFSILKKDAELLSIDVLTDYGNVVLAEGRLTDSVQGIQAPTSGKTLRWSQRQLRQQWRENFHSKGLPKLHGGKVLFVKSPAVLDGLAKPLAVFDVVRGEQIIYSTHSEYYAGNLDRDLAQLKLLIGSVQMVVGTIGTVAILVPDPITAAVECVVLVVSFGVEAALWIVAKIQERRIRNQSEMLCRITENERPGMLRELILRELILRELILRELDTYSPTP